MYFDDYLKEALKDPEIKKFYDEYKEWDYYKEKKYNNGTLNNKRYERNRYKSLNYNFNKI